jgi:hypothetical protein
MNHERLDAARLQPARQPKTVSARFPSSPTPRVLSLRRSATPEPQTAAPPQQRGVLHGRLILGANAPWVYALAQALSRLTPTTAVRLYDLVNWGRRRPRWPEIESAVRRVLSSCPRLCWRLRTHFPAASARYPRPGAQSTVAGDGLRAGVHLPLSQSCAVDARHPASEPRLLQFRRISIL